jgi:hypothetical protein
MSAAFWTAMSVKANLQTKKELASYGSTFVDYEIFYQETNGRKV